MARKAAKKSFDPNAFGTLGKAQSLDALLGGGGGVVIDSDTIIPENMVSGSGSFVTESGNAIFCERVNAISVIKDGVRIRQLLRGIKITIPGLDFADSGTTTTLVLPSGYPEDDDNFYGNRPVKKSDTYVYIKQGTNESQVRKVSSYDSSTRELTFTEAFPYAIDSSSQFEILDAIDVTSDYNVSFSKSLSAGTYITLKRSPFIFVSVNVSGTGLAEVYKS
jgi:hypothetical protein